ncbi:MAG: monovalent cation/H+ antiporter complex subunit F [Chromatiales bacterium]|jgi:multicomponent Na+:H+ antiporter subunit F
MISIDFTQIDWLVLVLFVAGILLTLVRLLKGPYAPDRIVAADTLSVIGTAGLVLLAFWLDSVLYLDVALIYAVLAFVGIIALARIIEGGAS